MLAFFPTPYPDELWYSVLCRYHIRSGNFSEYTTLTSLFQSKRANQVFRKIPDNSIAAVCANLPDGFLDFDEVIKNHTLFLSVYRLYGSEEKHLILEDLRNGVWRVHSAVRSLSNESELKVCPMCLKEDREQYGEPYWHVSHQIRLASVCQKHKCRLITYKWKDQSRKWALPCIDKIQPGEPCYAVSEVEMFLNQILIDYNSLPSAAGPTYAYNNLIEGLIDNGYGILSRDLTFSVDTDKLQKGIIDEFGEIFFEKNFMRTNNLNILIKHITNWEYRNLDKYVILAALIRQPASVTFSDTKINSKKYREITPIRRVMEARKRKQKEKISLKRETQKEKQEIENISFMIPETDWERIKKYIDEKGYAYSDFIRFCIDYVIDNNIIEKENGT